MHANLSPRQRMIVGGLATGSTIKEIAVANAVAIDTIRAHLRAIHLKTDTHTLVEAVLWVQEHAECCLA